MMANDGTVSPNALEIKRLRLEVAGWTQDTLADMASRQKVDGNPLNCSRSTVQKAERGERIRPENLKAIALALKSDYSELVAKPDAETMRLSANVDFAEGKPHTDEDLSIYFRRLLVAARGEPLRSDCVLLLQQTIDGCRQWRNESKSEEPIILGAQAATELAWEEPEPRERDRHWTAALAELEKAYFRRPSASLAECLAVATTDYCGDGFALSTPVMRRPYLVKAKSVCQLSANAGETSVEWKARLIARRSAIIRSLDVIDGIIAMSKRREHLEESLRAANAAARLSRAPAVLLEQALANWAMARVEKDDDEYYARMREVERLLTAEELKDYEPAALTLARYYRLSFRPLDACRSFMRFQDGCRQPRTVLRCAYLFAEAATQLWFENYPSEIVNAYVAEAAGLSERAISGGFNDARTILGQAFLISIRDGVHAGSCLLADLCSKEGLDWSGLITLLGERKKQDLATKGFALGITIPGTCSRLGTFASKILNRLDLAEAAHQAAVNLDKRHPIALTNLARVLATSHDPNQLTKARRLLGKAELLADRRFKWWRPLLSSVDQRILAQGNADVVHGNKPEDKWKERAVLRHPGIGLLAIAQRTLGLSSFFSHNPVGPGDIQFEFRFRNKGIWACCCTIETAESAADTVSGERVDYMLLLLNADPTEVSQIPSYIERNVPRLLMDRAEIGSVVKGWVNLDELLTIKMLYWEHERKCYFRVSDLSESALD